MKAADYSRPGIYFVTVCSDSRRCIFGRVEDAELIPSALGGLVRECWAAVPDHFPSVILDEFVLLPNHLHGILVFHPHVGAQHCCALSGQPEAQVKPDSVSAIVRSFKAIVTRRAHDELHWRGPVWQRNYFERIVRGGDDLPNTRRYIAENLRMWELDQDNPAVQGKKSKGAAVLRPYKNN